MSKTILTQIIYIASNGRQETYKHYSRKAITYRGAARVLKTAGIEGTVERIGYCGIE